MYIGQQSIGINQGIERVYRVASTYPNFVSFFLEGSKILSQNEKQLLVEVHSRVLGLKTSWQGEGFKEPNRFIRFTQTKGMFKGLQAHWQFESKEKDRTTVTIKTTFSKPFLTTFGEKLLGRRVVEKVTAKILVELKTQSEAQE